MARSRFLLRAAITLSSPVFSAVLAGINFQSLSKAATPYSPSRKAGRIRRFLKNRGRNAVSTPVRLELAAPRRNQGHKVRDGEGTIAPSRLTIPREGVCAPPIKAKGRARFSARPLEIYASLP